MTKSTKPNAPAVAPAQATETPASPNNAPAAPAVHRLLHVRANDHERRGFFIERVRPVLGGRGQEVDLGAAVRGGVGSAMSAGSQNLAEADIHRDSAGRHLPCFARPQA